MRRDSLELRWLRSTWLLWLAIGFFVFNNDVDPEMENIEYREQFLPRDCEFLTDSPLPCDISGGPCHCKVTGLGCSYVQETGTPFCLYCDPTRHSEGRCSCPCRACDPTESDWSSSDDVGELISPARWLQWKKTRDEIFGIDMETWCESWACHLILGDTASERQTYLWAMLAQDRHLQWGQGVLRIPSEGKRRRRAGRRRALAANTQKSSRVSVSGCGLCLRSQVHLVHSPGRGGRIETQCFPEVMHVEKGQPDMEVRVPIVHRFNH